MTTQVPLSRASETLPNEAVVPDQLCLIGWVDGEMLVVPLPARGRVTIGRGDEADVRIAHPTISRQHVAISLGRRDDARPVARVEDLGSRNGTRARGSALTPGEVVELTASEGLELGTVPLVLQYRRGDEPASQRRPVDARGVSPAMGKMLELRAFADRVAVGDINVLVLGETGAGKEILAEHIHETSPRRKGAFVRLNCAALPEQLLESELFGHERGAFTGAVGAKPGLLETAHGGTVFLDEAGDIPLGVQVKLLRVIDERRVQRVGGLTTRSIDVRFIAATNRDLTADVARGLFRRDLYFRLAGVTLNVPPLRERRDEIAALAEVFAERSAARLGRATPRLDTDALLALMNHAWPGNVRELRNMIERALLLSSGDRIGLEHLRFDDVTLDGDTEVETTLVTPRPSSSRAPSNHAQSNGSTNGHASPLREAVQDLERGRILAALEECAGNQTRAARMLGMPRATFVKRLDTFGLPRPRKR